MHGLSELQMKLPSFLGCFNTFVLQCSTVATVAIVNFCVVITSIIIMYFAVSLHILVTLQL